MAALHLLCGVDPHRHLTTADAVELLVTDRALRRALELREQELDHHAHRVIEFLAEALDG